MNKFLIRTLIVLAVLFLASAITINNVAESHKQNILAGKLSKKEDTKRYEVAAGASELAQVCLNENYPNWKDPGAYWDD